MVKKSSAPSYEELKKSLRYSLIQKSKPQPKPTEIVMRGAYNEPVPINPENGFYKFKSSASGSIVWRVSTLVRDYPTFPLAIQLTQFVKTYVAFSVAWLKNHGYGDVKISYVDGYQPLSQFASYDDQVLLRQRIMSDMLSVENTGRPMSQWRGLKDQPKFESMTIDYGAKG